MNPPARMLWGLTALLVITIIGTIGYVVIEGWSLLDSFYMTIATVGYSEVHPLSEGGKLFSIFIIVGGVGTAFYTLLAVTEYLLGGYLGTRLGRHRMKNSIAKLKDHFIICGYGRVGHGIAAAEKDGRFYLAKDATRDEVLKEAGIEKARGLVAAVGSDTDNTYITLSARGLRRDIFIVARASGDEVEKKLHTAGADRIVSPYSIAARRLAMLALRPAAVDYIDTISYGRGRELQLENIAVDEGSVLIGQTVGEARKCSKAIILAINHDGHLLANPSADEKIHSGDQLVVIGSRENLFSMENTCEGVKSP